MKSDYIDKQRRDPYAGCEDEPSRCPYAGCSFQGTDAEVDEHRTTGVHDDQPQGGSNRRK